MKLSSKGRRGIARLILLTSSLALVFGIAEGVARITWPKREAGWKRPPPGDLEKIEGLVALSQPNVLGQHVGVMFRTNSNAIRGPEISSQPAPGVVRVAITGDSVTAGWGVEEQHTYSTYLEEFLTETPIEGARETKGYEVLNFGLAGLNAPAAIDRLIQKSSLYQPRVAVYGYTVNDIEGPSYRKSDLQVDGDLAKRYRAKRFSRSYLIRVIWPNLIALREWLSPVPGSQLEAFYHNYFDNIAAWRDVDTALARFANWGRSEDVCVMLLLHTQLTNLGPFHLYHPMYDAVAKAAERHGVQTIRSFSRFDGANAVSYWIHLWDAHPNANGHRVLAEALDEGLRSLPAGCWRP
jgi:lysophospholipase L1-like esterase